MKLNTFIDLQKKTTKLSGLVKEQKKSLNLLI